MDGGSTRAAVGETSKNLIATTMQNNRIGDGSVEEKKKKEEKISEKTEIVVELVFFCCTKY